MKVPLSPKAPDARVDAIIKVAIMAVGGQGGGVLTNWIESVARQNGYVAQATSVAGVSQRTGATIYYIEMAPETGKQPIFALAPSAGDVDVLIAAEMMEVGRAIIRGFVTPDRTTLIGSTHRALAVSEKTVPGDGIANAEEVRAAAEIASQRLILADMERLAVSQGSVISASLLGALAGSGALPFGREAYEEAIRRSGKGVDASLAAFAAGFDVGQQGEDAAGTSPLTLEPRMVGPEELQRKFALLETRLTVFPVAVQEMVRAGLYKVVNFQDCDYGASYLDRLEAIVAQDTASKNYALGVAAAKYLANAMAYDDIIRVADIKTRKTRISRIRDEMGAQDSNLLHITEYFHPRAEEIAGMLPATWGARVEASPKAMNWLNRFFGKGRRLRTDSLRAFIMLHILGGLRAYRLKTHRHAIEIAHLEDWLARSLSHLPNDYDLAVELLKCRRLIKGYSDTHARGLTRFDTVMNAAEMLKGRPDAAEWIARLREAALQDPKGEALKGAIRTVRSFV